MPDLFQVKTCAVYIPGTKQPSSHWGRPLDDNTVRVSGCYGMGVHIQRVLFASLEHVYQ